MKLQLSHIAFELTDRCNLGCRYCYNIWKIPGAEHNGFNSYEKAIKALVRLFTQADIKNVTLTGGEPFMVERIREVALFCRMEAKSATIISNGYLGKISDYKSLIAIGITLFEFPVHSAEARVHAKIGTKC